MSVNRCRTKCECGLWDFEDFTIQDANKLMTPKEYLDEIGSHRSVDNNGHGWGWGYSPLTRYESKWYSSENFKSTSWHEGCELESTSISTPITLDTKYGFYFKECPLCGVKYVLWMVLQDGTKYHTKYTDDRPDNIVTNDPYYLTSDTSYYHSFNDEPSEKDVENKVEVTRDELIQAWKEYNDH